MWRVFLEVLGTPAGYMVAVIAASVLVCWLFSLLAGSLGL
jgi:hypothetical protein